MLWLQSKDRFNDVVELNETTGDWRLVSRTSEGENIPGLSNMDGSFSMLSGVFCALFCSHDEIFVRIGETQIRLSDDIEILVDGPPEKRCLSLVVSGREHVRLEYALASKPIEGDPTAFTENEDFDFGLFLSNIAHSPNRQAVLKGEA
ncbi:MAG: hypothetical protein KatS3mg105_2032 [Gemmatales bacterium]|nr:MAG: hypothetical protein KatS3mg105_2032 [Gemmatales bacterium]